MQAPCRLRAELTLATRYNNQHMSNIPTSFSGVTIVSAIVDKITFLGFQCAFKSGGGGGGGGEGKRSMYQLGSSKPVL